MLTELKMKSSVRKRKSIFFYYTHTMKSRRCSSGEEATARAGGPEYKSSLSDTGDFRNRLYGGFLPDAWRNMGARSGGGGGGGGCLLPLDGLSITQEENEHRYDNGGSDSHTTQPYLAIIEDKIPRIIC